MKKALYTILLFWIFFLFKGCDHPFVYSPFESAVPERFRHTTEKNLRLLQQRDTLDNKPFKVALISDSHYHFRDLSETVEDINKKQEAAFIILAGDITENGLLKEYEIFHELMSRSAIPYLTVIGNHDHLSNGSATYRELFGPLNYTFTFNHVKFVAWDNTVWESHSIPDLNWLEDSLDPRVEEGIANAGVPYHHVIPLSHIPPFDLQADSYRDEYTGLLSSKGIRFSIHGHKHEFFSGDLYGDGVTYLTIGSPQKRSYAVLTISPEKIMVEKISF